MFEAHNGRYIKSLWQMKREGMKWRKRRVALLHEHFAEASFQADSLPE